MATPRIYGLRKCQRCKGICHQGSYRTNFFRRNKYWCSKACLLSSRPHALDSFARDMKLYGCIDVITK